MEYNPTRNLEHKESCTVLSTSFITHFTKEFCILKKILNDGFKPGKPEFGENILGKVEPYELNNISHLNDENLNNKIISQDSNIERFYMVCFCDIPFSKAKKHMIKYGGYGISLTKSWALNNFINPVNYIFKDSPNHWTLFSLNNQLNVLKNEITKPGIEFKQFNIFNLEKTIEEINKMSKEYYDFDKKIKYYDEREWRRYYPNFEIEDIKKYYLKFEPKDIKYIIVKSKEEKQEINELMKRIWDIDFENKIRILN